MRAEQILIERGLADSVWGKIIIKAEKNSGLFSHEDTQKSGEWQTCACGEQDPRIPRMESMGWRDGQPEDRGLFHLGMEFHDAINVNQPVEAAITLVQIEERAIAVLKELGLS